MSTVLIIDDDLAMREALAESSTDLGFYAWLAPTGRAVLAGTHLRHRGAIAMPSLPSRGPSVGFYCGPQPGPPFVEAAAHGARVSESWTAAREAIAVPVVFPFGA